MDISKLSHMCDFDFEIEALGKIRCGSVNSDQLSKIGKMLQTPELTSSALARQVFGMVSTRTLVESEQEGTQAEGNRLTAEEISQITDEEIEKWCLQFLEGNTWLLDCHEATNLKHLVGEGGSYYLVRAFRHYAEERKKEWERFKKLASGNLFTDSTLESLRRNAGLSDQLRSTIDGYRQGLQVQDIAGTKFESLPLHTPDLRMPENPLHKTNERLGNVLEHLEGMRPVVAQCADLIRDMNDTALRMQSDFIRNSRSAQRYTLVAIGIAALSLVASSWFSWLSYNDSKQSSERGDSQLKMYQQEIRSLINAQEQERVALVNALKDARKITQKRRNR